MSTAQRLSPQKKPTPIVRVTYTMKAANGNYLITKDAKNITAKY